MKEPPRRVELPGHDARTVPAKPSLKAQVSTLSASPAPPDREPAPQVDIPVETLAMGTQVLPGAMDAPPAAPTRSQGTVRTVERAPALAAGDGPGRGRGFGDGLDAGTGGDVYRARRRCHDADRAPQRHGAIHHGGHARACPGRDHRRVRGADRTAYARTFASSAPSIRLSAWIRRRSRRRRSGGSVRACAADWRCRCA